MCAHMCAKREILLLLLLLFQFVKRDLGNALVENTEEIQGEDFDILAFI